MKRIIALIIFFGLLFSSFLYFYLKPSAYELTYTVDDFEVMEKYLKEEKKYQITIKNKDYLFNYTTFDKYTRKRKLVTKIETEKINDAYCLKPESESLSLYPLCLANNEYISYFALNMKNNATIVENYENINIYNYVNKTYLLWNYHNFIYLNKEKEAKQEILDKDLYNLKLVMATDKYLVIPSQENEFTFNKIFILEVSKNKMKTYNLDKEIYFDSYYLGNYKNKIYIVDRKNVQEYEINLTNGKQTKVDGKILNAQNKWEKVNINKLVHNDYHFFEETNVTYELNDMQLYALIDKQKIKITNQKVSEIVKGNAQEIFYLAGDSLYYFNYQTGIEKLMSYSEWEFNYHNMVYIFD